MNGIPHTAGERRRIAKVRLMQCMHEWDPTYCWREEKDCQSQTYARVKHFTGKTSA